MVNNIIEPKYRVNVYLDTNILVDYMEKTFPLLTKSIDFLAQCPFVNLRSSHYVLFEFTEVRKAKLFWEKADPDKTKPYDDVRGDIRREWKYMDKQYSDFTDEIIVTVNKELAIIKNDLQIDFDEHVLHDGLIYPTNNLCLATRISKEDCLVMVSCMRPRKNENLEHCLLLTRDAQYYTSYTENSEMIKRVFSDNELNSPVLIRTEALTNVKSGRRYNLYDSNGCADIDNYWIWLILHTLKNNNSLQYIGTTYKHGRHGDAPRCVYFEMAGSDKVLRESSGFYFISNDLTQGISLNKPLEYWNGDKVKLPHTNPDFPKYSFKAENLSPEILTKLREEGNIVFYDDV